MESLGILESYRGDGFSGIPNDEFGMYCAHWISLICGVDLIIIGIAGIAEGIVKKDA